MDFFNGLLEVIGLDLDGSIHKDTAVALRKVWREAGLVLFRDVGTSPTRLLTLSKVFGELEPHPIEALRLAGHPELILLSSRTGVQPVYAYDGVPTYGRIPWHTDLAFQTVPNAGALLNMVESASIGGQTAWLDTAAAHDSLDPSLRRRLEGLEVRFEFSADLSLMRFQNAGGVRIGRPTAAFPDFPAIARPIIWRHPVTGREILNICPLNLRGIVGMDEHESAELLDVVLNAVCQPRFTYEHDWEDGDVMLWDNYRMMHRATGHPLNVTRTVHRTTLRGTASVGRALAPSELL